MASLKTKKKNALKTKSASKPAAVKKAAKKAVPKVAETKAPIRQPRKQTTDTAVRTPKVVPQSPAAKKAAPVKGHLPKIRSRHPSHDVLRGRLPRMPYSSVIRFGSETEVDTARVEINTIEAVRNSASKLRMKNCFTQAGVKSADWVPGGHNDFPRQIQRLIRDKENKYRPVVAKRIFGSRGEGNTLLRTQQDYNNFLHRNAARLHEYIFEVFHNYTREYRLHVTADGCFYTCRKMLKNGTPDKDKWFRNDSNSVWIVEDNEQFDRPANWEEIEEECIKALESVGLDFGACDVKVQSATDSKGKTRENPEFIVIEINSAPSFGEITAQRYAEMLPELIRFKYELSK